MKSILKLFLATLLVVAISTGCKKYEEGPSVSVLTRTMRLCGEWKITSVVKNGFDITDSFVTACGGSGFVLHIQRDRILHNEFGKFHTEGGIVPVESRWQWEDDKSNVYFSERPAAPFEFSYEIIKLKGKELGLRYTDGMDVTVLRFK